MWEKLYNLICFVPKIIILLLQPPIARIRPTNQMIRTRLGLGRKYPRTDRLAFRDWPGDGDGDGLQRIREADTKARDEEQDQTSLE